MSITEPIQIRRGIEAQRTTQIFLTGELAYAVDSQRLYIGDGITPGGLLLSSASGNSGSFNISPQTYFSGLKTTITGAQNITDGLAPNQGYRTNRVNMLSGNYTGTFNLASANSFAGAVLVYVVSTSGLNPALIFQDQTTSNILASQTGLSGNIKTYFQFGNDGTQWLLDQWQ